MITGAYASEHSVMQGYLTSRIYTSLVKEWTMNIKNLRAFGKKPTEKNSFPRRCNIKCSNGLALSVCCTCHFPPTKLDLLLDTACHTEICQHRDGGSAIISGEIICTYQKSWLSIEGVLDNHQAHLLGLLTTECTTWCKVNWSFWALKDQSSGCILLSQRAIWFLLTWILSQVVAWARELWK